MHRSPQNRTAITDQDAAPPGYIDARKEYGDSKAAALSLGLLCSFLVSFYLYKSHQSGTEQDECRRDRNRYRYFKIILRKLNDSDIVLLRLEQPSNSINVNSNSWSRKPDRSRIRDVGLSVRA